MKEMPVAGESGSPAIGARTTADTGSWILGMSPEEVVWSDEMHRIFETSPAGFTPSWQSFLDRVHPEDRARFQLALEASFQTRRPASLQHRIITSSGEVKHIEQHWQILACAANQRIVAAGTCQDITSRKKTEEQCEAGGAAQRLAVETQVAIQDALPAHVALIDPEGNILSVNESWRRFSESAVTPTSDFFIGHNYLRACESAAGAGAEEAVLVAAGLRGVLAGGSSKFEMEYECHAPGERCWFRLMVTPLREGRKAGAVVMHIDVTERRMMEERLSRLNGLYQVLSRVNETIVRCKNLQELAEMTCRIAVDHGMFRTASIFALDEEAEEAVVVAHGAPDWRRDEAVPEKIPLKALGGGTMGTALRTGRYNVCNDVANDPRMLAWKEFAASRGYRSTASFPIFRAGRVFGILVLSATETEYFQDDEVRLLVSVADDLSFAIESLDKEERRVRVEAALRDSEAMMAVAQRIGQFGSWELDLPEGGDPGSNRLMWSDGMYRVAGLEPNGPKITNERFFQLVPEEDREAIRAGVAEAIRTCGPFSLVHRMIRPDGEERIIHETAQLFVDERTGRPFKMVGNAHDITEQRRAEQTLRESDRRFRELAENVSEVFWITGPGGNDLLYVSPAFERVWGWSCESLYRTPRLWVDAVVPEDRERVLQAEALQSNGGYDVLYRIVRSDGRIRWIHDRAYPVSDETGKLHRIVGTAEDVTDREVAREKLREQATLLDKAQDAILVRDLNQRILYWNRGAERLYGWAAEEVLGKTELVLYHRESAAFAAAMRSVLECGEWMGELEQVARDGKVLTVESRWTLVRDERDRPKSILTINTDISGRKDLEQQFLRAQRMESIGTLAGGIAHDLNNVLAPIMMSIDLLKMYPQEPRALEILSMIGTSARRGAEMVSQVLSFARGVEGRRGKVSVEGLVGELLKITAETFPKDIRVAVELDAGLWTLEADGTQLHQVLLNLCVNARDAMAGGGLITLAAANVRIDAGFAAMNPGARPGPHVRLEVTDTGTGMPPEVMGNCFDPFFTTKEIGKGTGLGLSTAMAIVKGHGGFIQLRSRPGAGTAFRIYLPATEGAVADSPPVPMEEMRQGRGELVLIVDDEAPVRRITRQILERFGYRVLEACDGAEAVSVFVENQDEIGVVLTDMMMPIMDGPSLVNILRGMKPEVRVIGTSGIGAGGLLTGSGQVEVGGFIAKPFTAEALLRAVGEILGRG